MVEPGPTHAEDPDDSVIPKPVSAKRVRLVTAGIVLGLAVIMVVPAWLAAPLADPAPIFMTAGVVAGFGSCALPHLCVARKPWHRHGPGGRFLTVRTWTGHRTIDLHRLRSVRTWKEAYRGGATTSLIVTDASGTRVGFTGPQAERLIRRYAVEQPRGTRTSRPIRVTRLARADLGIKPLPRGLSALRSLLSVERFALLIVVPMMVSAAIASH
ncbi:hypothetical protein ACGF3G_11955 [Streptomyces sp. NPDC048179]|uniref:hypothetical protein n=1 Tax=Streptomyces sp. NPDC048179 TaxID=3365506 RepID=UPI00371DF17B